MSYRNQLDAAEAQIQSLKKKLEEASREKKPEKRFRIKKPDINSSLGLFIFFITIPIFFIISPACFVGKTEEKKKQAKLQTATWLASIFWICGLSLLLSWQMSLLFLSIIVLITSLLALLHLHEESISSQRKWWTWHPFVKTEQPEQENEE